ncbi:hypothetical protein DY000_02036656 [Brassica cretica]|uniref:Uncharacterized protein n=1 Tax=Brassica cretica TaxID=69181 RepID=A0ABQ7BL59_BRACR|nr:hypothetical protein DY000_02036656 [Brassica cretica]
MALVGNGILHVPWSGYVALSHLTATNQESGIRNQESGIRNQESGIRIDSLQEYEYSVEVNVCSYNE